MGFLGKLRRGKWNPFNRRRNLLDRRKTKPALSFGSKGSMFEAKTPEVEIGGKNRRIRNPGRRKGDRPYS